MAASEPAKDKTLVGSERDNSRSEGGEMFDLHLLHQHQFIEDDGNGKFAKAIELKQRNIATKQKY